jgi:O-antigen/teichoic acid export membrane protein
VQAINGILGYLAIFLVARYMAMPDYALGVVSFAYGLVNIFYIFSDLGFHNAHVKRISEGQDFATAMGTFTAVKIALTGLMGVLLIGGMLFWTHIIGRGFESPEHQHAIYVMLLYFILWSFTQIMRATFRAKKQTAKEQLPMFVETLARVAATVYVIQAGLGAVALAWTYVAGEVAVLATTLLFFKGYNIGKPSWEMFKSYISFAIPLAIVVASTRIMTNVDKVLVQLFWGAVEGGNYFAIFRLSRFLDMITIAIGVLLFPTISAMFSYNDMDGIKRISFTAERYLSMVMFPVVFGMIFLARPIIHIMLSNKFYPAVPILQVLPLFALLDALERPYQMKLWGMNLPNFARNRILIMVVLNVGLNLVLIPRDIRLLGLDLPGLGAFGAAVATVIAYAAGLLYTRVIVWRVSRITFNKRIALHGIAAGVMGILVYYLNDMVYPVARWYGLIGYGFLGLGIYLGLLALMREFTREDLDLFLDTLNIKKMIEYIKDEITGN